MKVSELIKYALEHTLVGGKYTIGINSKYACHAICLAERDTAITDDDFFSLGLGVSSQAKAAIAAIRKEIEERGCVEEYLTDHGFADDPYEFRKEMLKKLIAQFEAEGN